MAAAYPCGMSTSPPTSKNWLTKTAGPIQKDASTLDVILRSETIGYRTDSVYLRHQLMFTGMGAGTATIQYLAPDGLTWVDISTGHANNDVVEVDRSTSPATLRCLFVGGDATGSVTIRSHAVGF